MGVKPDKDSKTITLSLYHKQNEYSIEIMQIYGEYFQIKHGFCIFIHIYSISCKKKNPYASDG